MMDNLLIRDDTISISSEKSSKSISQISPVSPFTLSNNQDIAEKCGQENWLIQNFISNGKYGSTYVACDKENCSFVLKIQKADTSFYNEVSALTDLQKTGLSPKIYDAWTCKGNGYIIMEKLVKCELTEEEIYKQIKSITRKLNKNGWLHVDIHSDNFLCRDNAKKIVMIDFGWAVKKGPLGNNQTYPYHPLSKRYRKPVTWEFLSVAQLRNSETAFNPQKTPEQIHEMEKVNKIYKNAKSDFLRIK